RHRSGAAVNHEHTCRTGFHEIRSPRAFRRSCRHHALHQSRYRQWDTPTAFPGDQAAAPNAVVAAAPRGPAILPTSYRFITFLHFASASTLRSMVRDLDGTPAPGHQMANARRHAARPKSDV